MYFLSYRYILTVNKFFNSCSKYFYLNITGYKYSIMAQGPPWKILFFGTDSFALKCLKAIYTKFKTGTIISQLGVVTKEKSIVKQFAEEESLQMYDWPLDVKKIQSYHIGIVVSFGKLIPLDVIEALPLGCINVHPSLLPRWRGASPIFYSILHGDSETGVTIMKIRPHRFDIGDIVRQYRTAVGPHDTTMYLQEKLSDCGCKLLLECIRDLPRCIEMAVPQPLTGITYAPKLKKTISHVNWSKSKATDVYNLHRAVNCLYPVVTDLQGTRVKLIDLSLGKLNLGSSGYMPGDIIYNKANNELSVVCLDLRTIVVHKLFIHKMITPVEFYNGYLTNKSKTDWKFNSL